MFFFVFISSPRCKNALNLFHSFLPSSHFLYSFLPLHPSCSLALFLTHSNIFLPLVSSEISLLWDFSSTDTFLLHCNDCYLFHVDWMRVGWCFVAIFITLCLFFFFFEARISIFMSLSLSYLAIEWHSRSSTGTWPLTKSAASEEVASPGILIFLLLTDTKNVVIVKENESQPDSEIKVIAISITITTIIMMMASIDNDHCDGHMSIELVMEGVRILTMIMMMVSVVRMMLGIDMKTTTDRVFVHAHFS